MAVSSAQATEEISYMLTAAGKGDLAAVNAMLNSGASANVKDADGITALMYAARKNNAEVASALLNKGADVNAKDNGGWTALMFAAKKNYIDHTYHDHASILKFIEHNWGLPPLTNRSRDNLPNPLKDVNNPYRPTNQPAVGDLTTFFKF